MSDGGHVIVPVTGDNASAAAVRIACDLVKRERRSLEFVHVIEVPRALPMDADLTEATRHGELVLRRAEEAANGIASIRGELLQARTASTAILEEIRTASARLLIMGVPARSPLGKFELGPTAEAVLKGAPCEVWLIREAAAKP